MGVLRKGLVRLFPLADPPDDGEAPEEWEWWQDAPTKDSPHTPGVVVAVGMRCGPEPIVAIDLDISKKAAADKMELMATVVLGEPLAVREREGNASRRPLIYRQKPSTMPITKKALALKLVGDEEKHLVEVLGRGQQTVIEGPHAKGATHYWRDGKGLAERSREELEDAARLELADILRFTMALAEDVKTQGGEIVVEHKAGKVRDRSTDVGIESPVSRHFLPPDKRGVLTKAIQAIDLNDDRLASYDEWAKLYLAICALVGRDTEYFHDVVLPWLLTYEKNTPEDMELKWRNAFKTSSLVPEYVYRIAAQFGCKEARDALAAELGVDPSRFGVKLKSRLPAMTEQIFRSLLSHPLAPSLPATLTLRLSIPSLRSTGASSSTSSNTTSQRRPGSR